MADGQGSVNFDIRLPGLQKLRNASASATIGAINRGNPEFPVGQFPNWRSVLTHHQSLSFLHFGFPI